MTDIVANFLKRHNFSVSEPEADEFINVFQQEMTKGLEGQSSTLAMIPTYVEVNRSIPTQKPVVVIDAGGTNLRVCSVSFNDNGEAKIENFSKAPMPGTRGELSSKAFFKSIGTCVSPILEANPDIDSIGFCFSYPSEILPNRDGKLLRWTKEVQAPEVVGQELGRELMKALGKEDLNITVLNDTVATLLAGKAEGDLHRCSSYAGFILGTGTNIATVENNSAITKVKHENIDGEQAINLESGSFSLIHQSDFDQRLDLSTKNPGDYTLEKMISGVYLGPLFYEALCAAIKDNLLSESFGQHMAQHDTLTTLTLNQIISHPFGEHPFKDISEDDLDIVVQIGQAILDRAARLCALKVAASLSLNTKPNTALHPICINVDGSTIHKMKGYHSQFEHELKRVLKAKGIHVMLVQKEHSPILGSAIAALTNG